MVLSFRNPDRHGRISRIIVPHGDILNFVVVHQASECILLRGAESSLLALIVVFWLTHLRDSPVASRMMRHSDGVRNGAPTVEPPAKALRHRRSRCASAEVAN